MEGSTKYGVINMKLKELISKLKVSCRIKIEEGLLSPSILFEGKLFDLVLLENLYKNLAEKDVIIIEVSDDKLIISLVRG